VSEIDDLRELLSKAGSSFRTLHATVHQLTDDAGMYDAHVRRNPDPVSRVSSAPRPKGVIEFLERIWTDGRGRWRIERSSYHQDPRPPAVTVMDGSRWWMYSLETGAISNEDEPDTTMGNRSVIEPLLDPSVLFETSDLRVTGTVMHAGREGIGVRATTRAPNLQQPHIHGPFGFGDHHDLIIDAERGVILRDIGFINDFQFWLTDVEKVSFDPLFGDQIFTLEPPPGVELKRSLYPRPRSVSIEEAAGLAPFRVFMPTFVPEGAHTEVMFQPGQDRPSVDPRVTVQYSGADERSSIMVSESATASLWGGVASIEGWEEVVEADSTLLFNERSLFQAEKAVRIDRDGTTIFIHGGPDRSGLLEIDREVLFQIARSLVPVPRNAA
jgi:outer membrane lipoprotein-sorting protein